jgi:hypothetical protein
MSHFTEIETQLASAEHLVKALRDLGFDRVEVHAQPQSLEGWVGEMLGNKAHVIVRLHHAGLEQGDLGFLQTKSGYFRAMVPDAARARFGAAWMRTLTQRYAYHVACDMLEKQDFHKVEETRELDGTIRMTVRRMA